MKLATFSFGRSSAFLLCLLTAAYLCFWGLRQQSISDVSDEVIHIRVTQEMLHERNWWQPTHGGVPYHNKPPLKMWLSLIPLNLLGESNFSYRLVDGVLGIGTIALVFLLGLQLFRSTTCATFAALLLLGTASLIHGRHGFRTATQDGALVFFSTLAMLSCWKLTCALSEQTSNDRCSRSSKRWALVLGSSIAAGVLCKSVAGFLPLLVSSAWIVSCASITSCKLRFRSLAIVWLIAFTIPAIYLLPNYLLVDGAFSRMIMHEAVDRLVSGVHHRNEPLYYFRYVFQKGVFGSATLMLVALCWGLYVAVTSALFKGEQSEITLGDGSRNSSFPTALLYTISWALLLLVMLSVVRSRLIWYLMPAYPAFALLCAAPLVELRRRWKFWRTSRESLWSWQFVRLCCLLAYGSYGSIIIAQNLAQAAKGLSEQAGSRVLIDTVVESINEATDGQTASRFAHYRQPFDLGAETVQGHFNREAIYVRILRPELATTLRSVDELADFLKQTGPRFTLSPWKLALAHLGSLKWRQYAVIEPTRRRKDRALFLTNDTGPLPGFATRDLTIDFGKEELSLLFGMGAPRTNGTIAFRYGGLSRAAVQLTGDILRKSFPHRMLLNVGHQAPHSKETLSLQVTLNEFQLQLISLKRNAIDTYEIQVPAGAMDPGPNVLQFNWWESSARKGFKPKSEIIFNWLRLEPILPAVEY